MMPVSPPIVKTKMNPIANSIGVSNVNDPFHIVPSQLKTLMPVGIAITIVVYMKKSWAATGIPTVNMWCAHTDVLMKAIANIASTIER